MPGTIYRLSISGATRFQPTARLWSLIVGRTVRRYAEVSSWAFGGRWLRLSAEPAKTVRWGHSSLQYLNQRRLGDICGVSQTRLMHLHSRATLSRNTLLTIEVWQARHVRSTQECRRQENVIDYLHNPRKPQFCQEPVRSLFFPLAERLQRSINRRVRACASTWPLAYLHRRARHELPISSPYRATAERHGRP
jgi:hypothetical protein